MKKSYLLMSIIVLSFLTACGKKEIVVQPIPDVTEEMNYRASTVPVIDAIIDTEAEVRYMEKIQQDYSQLANYYEGMVSNTSGMTMQSDSQNVLRVQESMRGLMGDIEAYTERINKMDMPDEYRQALNRSLQAFIHSLQDEQTRLGGSDSDGAKPSSELYEKAQQASKDLNHVYRNLLGR